MKIMSLKYRLGFAASGLRALVMLAIAALGCTSPAQADSSPVESAKEHALSQIRMLEDLTAVARSKSIDVTREETVLWFSREFLKFADWDQSHKDEIEYLFGEYPPYKKDKARYAAELPDFERKKVVEMLDRGIATLQQVLKGGITRRPVAKVDWGNITVGKDALLSNGKPVFLYDYFSKSVGRPLTDRGVYNDHLGAIYHGGSRLYEVNKDRAVNSYLLQRDGTFDQKGLGYITEIPDTNVGFLILWNMGIPDWVQKAEPEAQKGRSLFTGFDIDNPLVREVWSRIIRKAGELTRGKKVTQLGYILSNEPHWYSEEGAWTQQFGEMSSISSYTLDKFRAWLDRKYLGDIAGLNRNWGSSFGSFQAVEIAMPIPRSARGQPLWYDWCRFNMDRSVDWFRFLRQELHATNPEADTHIKIMPRMFTDNSRSQGIDLEALTELTTMIGDDAKATGGRSLTTPDKPEKWEARYAYHWEEIAHSYDFMESVSPEKIHVNSETHFISASAWRDLNTSPDYIRSVFWLATLHGMDAGISWFWARDPDGSPEDRLEGELNFFDPALAGSYAGSINMQPQTANEVTQVFMDMNSYSEEIMALRHQRRPLRIFHSETSAINKPFHMTEEFEVYESLYFDGFPLGFATEKIIKQQDPRNWDVILVYKTEFVTDAEFDALQGYLDNGGTVLLDSEASLARNEYGQLRPRHLVDGKGKLVVMEKGSTLARIREKALELVELSRPAIVLTEANGTAHQGCTWRVVKNPRGGFWVNILNLGKNTATVKLKMKNGQPVTATDMLTGQALGSEFGIKPDGVLLLQVSQSKASATTPVGGE
jgi:beta-galactosidase